MKLTATIQSSLARTALPCMAIVITLALSGCSSRFMYNTVQGWQQNQCNRWIDENERERCLSKASMSYEDYKRQTEDGKK